MKKTAYYNGLRELLEKEFLFRSPYGGTFFVNTNALLRPREASAASASFKPAYSH
jgi:hypothetical protein